MGADKLRRLKPDWVLMALGVGTFGAGAIVALGLGIGLMIFGAAIMAVAIIL